MAQIFKNIFYIFSGLIVLWGCETEVELFGDPKEKAVVYALLNPADSIQYFRVNPTFIGEGDARTVAGDASNTNFDENEVTVQLINLETDQVLTCLETTDIPLDPDGIFSTQNRLYYVNTEVEKLGLAIDNKVLFPGYTYRVQVTKPSTGDLYYADAVMADYNDINLLKPNTSSLDTRVKWMAFHSGIQFVKYQFYLSRADNVERYAVTLRYYYTELGDDPESKAKYVDINIGQVRTEDVAGSTITMDFEGEEFYKILSTNLSGKSQLTGQRADIFVTAMGKEIDAFINVSSSEQVSLTQDITSYSNVTNGLGVVGFRTFKVFENIMLDEASSQQLISGTYTGIIFDCGRHGTTSNSQGVVKCDD